MRHPFYNVQHSPIGAFASFTLGCIGAKGGLAVEMGKPADQNVFIGLESPEPNHFDALPFFEGADDEAKRYDVEADDDHQPDSTVTVRPFAKDVITRTLKASTDTWQAGDLTLRVLSPVRGVPDPQAADDEAMKLAIVPAVLVELTVDNTKGTQPRRAFFGYQGNDPYSSMRRLDDTSPGKLVGIGQGRVTAIATQEASAVSGQGFTIDKVVGPEIPENLVFGLGGVGAINVTAPAGQVTTFRFAVCFHRDGIATSGADTRYYYTKYFANIDQVAQFALANFDTYKQWADEADAMVDSAALSDDQKWMLAHTIHSYYGSTQFLEWVGGDLDGQPYWVVNEGEYRMMNTFDLTVDQLFYEMRLNPWAVRNELDTFVKRYSYQDKVRFPGDATEHPGGISFTHDQGMGNRISRPHYSTYELFKLDGCFSHMTHEQLTNFVCCSAVYLAGTGDEAWYAANEQVLLDCLSSMVNRDHPEPSKRNGIMGLDSSRVMGGAEITTYDSLDVSLGQARNNLYMAVKGWAGYVMLEKLFAAHGKADAAKQAGEQAERCAATLCEAITDSGYIPGVMFEGNDSKIIPAIEGLVFPYVTDCREALDPHGRFDKLIATLKQHIETVLVKGTCLFDDGAWKISSTSDNSWLSKVYLSQFVYRQVLGMDWGEAGAAADAAHVQWLLADENVYWAWSDQMVNGVARGSKYYPRGVTSILWLDETN